MKLLLAALFAAGAGLLLAPAAVHSVRSHVGRVEESARHSVEETGQKITRGLASWEDRLTSDLEEMIDRLPDAPAPAAGAPATQPGWRPFPLPVPAPAPAPEFRVPARPLYAPEWRRHGLRRRRW